MKKCFSNVAILLMLSFGSGSALAEDIIEAATKSGSFKLFVAAAKSAGFSETLKNSGPYTVFAPTDDAFAKLSPGQWEALSKDRIKLAKVISYHVIPGKVMVTEVKPGPVKTTEGTEIKLKSDNGKITVNEANVTLSDIPADNGVIHAIDQVLIPAS